jgi:hypothetical protein
VWQTLYAFNLKSFRKRNPLNNKSHVVKTVVNTRVWFVSKEIRSAEVLTVSGTGNKKYGVRNGTSGTAVACTLSFFTDGIQDTFSHSAVSKELSRHAAISSISLLYVRLSTQ